MTDVRKVPWRLPAGYEDLKYFWDNFIKVLGGSIDAASTIQGGIDGGFIWTFGGDCGFITEALTLIFDCGSITDSFVNPFDCGAIV